MTALDLLPLRSVAELRAAMPAVDPEAREVAQSILRDVLEGGSAAIRQHAQRLGDLDRDSPLILGRDELQRALASQTPATRGLLERTAQRIRGFATAQRNALLPVETDAEGIRCGHEVAPVQRAGCYAPGGRYPLPSSVFMTAVTARAAGVDEVWVASPRPSSLILAAAAVAGADGVIAAGGAQGIAALAFGCREAEHTVHPSDVIVGPGNRFVTAAKQQLFGQVGLDGLAGPSELVVIADESADPGRVAADLLAQAEHDPDARPVLLALSPSYVATVRQHAETQLADLATANVARVAMQRGGAAVAATVEQLAESANGLAAEHLSLHVENPESLRPYLQHYGALFLGSGTAEVLGDYGAGPNHVLPTGGTARFTGGLSVFTFLRIRTWMTTGAGDSSELLADTAALARLEGLEAHARAAELRG